MTSTKKIGEGEGESDFCDSAYRISLSYSKNFESSASFWTSLKK